MESLRQKTSGKLSANQQDLLIGLFLVLLLAVIYYAQWGLYLTSVPDSKVNIDLPQKYFWWADDSREYRLTGDWLFGRADQTWVDLRPWFYPFLIGLARTIFGQNAERILWTSQFLMWLVSAVLIFITIYNASQRVFLAMIGAILSFSHPSPLILTFHGMTETLNILLLCVFCWLMSIKARSRYLIAIFLLSLLTATKPTYQIQLALLLIYVIVREIKLPKLHLTGWIAAALIPVWIQMAVFYSYTSRLGISDIGSYTFKYFYVAVVHSHSENIDWHESEKAVVGWSLQQQLSYLQAHPREALLTLRQNLIDTNLWIGSFFIRGESNRMIGFVETFNAVTTYAHLFMLPLVFYYLLSPRYKGNKELIALIYGVFFIQTLVTVISTGQDDRLTVTGIPLWIISYILVFFHLFIHPESEASGVVR